MSTIKSLLSMGGGKEPETKPETKPEPAAPEAFNVDEAIAEIARRTGLPQDQIVRRLFCWFCQQDEVVQAMVLGQIPAALMGEVSSKIADRMNFPSAA